MGLRSLNIPANAQPKDIGNPIPSESDTLGSVLGSYNPKPAPQMAQAQQAPQQEPTLDAAIPPPGGPSPASTQSAQPVPQTQPEQPQPSLTDKQKQDSEDVNSDLAHQASKTEAGRLAKMQAEEDAAAKIFGALPDKKKGQEAPKALDRLDILISSVGRNPQERANILNQDALGKIGGNAKVDENDVIHVSMGPNEPYKPINEVSPQDFFGKVAAHGGTIAQVGAEGAMQVGLNSTNLLMPGPGAVAGLIIPPIVGGKLREAAVNYLGGTDPNYSTKQEMLTSMGMGAALHSLVLTGKLAATTIQEVAANTQLSRLEKLGTINLEMDKIIQGAKLNRITAQAGGEAVAEIGPKMTGKALSQQYKAGDNFSQLLERSQRNLGIAVRDVNEKAITKSGDIAHSVQPTIDALADTISKQGGVVDAETGRFFLPEATGTGIKKVISNPNLDEVAKNEVIAQAGKANVAFGDEQGTALLGKMINDHNALLAAQNANGGVTMSELINRTQKYQSIADYGSKEGLNADGNNALQSIGSSSRADRIAAMKDTFGEGSAEYKEALGAYEKFSKDIGPLLDAKAAVTKGSPQLVADSVFLSGKPQQAAQLKQILGGTQEWEDLRSAFILNRVDAAKTSSGVFDSYKFIESLGPEKVGKDMLNVLGDVQGVAELKRMAMMGDRVANSDLLTAAQGAELTRTITQASRVMKNPKYLASMVWSVFDKNKMAIDYLTDEGFMKALEGANTPAQREILKEANRIVSQVAEDSTIVNVKGIKRYVPMAKALQNAVTTSPVVGGVTRAASTALSKSMNGGLNSGGGNLTNEQAQAKIQQRMQAPPEATVPEDTTNPPGE